MRKEGELCESWSSACVCFVRERRKGVEKVTEESKSERLRTDAQTMLTSNSWLGKGVRFSQLDQSTHAAINMIAATICRAGGRESNMCSTTWHPPPLSRALSLSLSLSLSQTV
jgi:hypothetical protein